MYASALRTSSKAVSANARQSYALAARRVAGRRAFRLRSTAAALASTRATDMPPTLSPAGRLRSRTSDISDLLRGRHDAKTSTDSQQRPPPIPTHLADPVTPTTKPKGKFSFLGRKRKPSAVSPSSARVANDAVAAKQGQDGEGALQSSPGLDPRVDAPTG
ncbi:hypothetical protein NUW54_g6456 [Trametes sanguinea]|uniref:Uncharacterized protein n=1 Tax=Trametes sanguinea TaxID=158606 RepID=A0ACC1PTV8_9APHY|nr:hypothetical protein NUW54_g6456 [Trametes sanguinea]